MTSTLGYFARLFDWNVSGYNPTDMPSISENLQEWDVANAWPKAGDEWSEWWGTAHAQWVGCLLPRVFPFLKGRILEIAPGHGRWTQFLQAHCSSLIGIDLSKACVEQCTERFRQDPNLEFKVNDGFTFPMIESGSIDFAFSYDSLVHAESDVMSSYAKELARVLKPGGVAFLHHSNLEAVSRRSLSDKVKRRVSGLPWLSHWRASSMSAEKMRTLVEGAGMMCAQQEIIPWGTGWPVMIDCMSTIVNKPGNQCHVVRNPRFMQEAASVKLISSLRPEGDWNNLYHSRSQTTQLPAQIARLNNNRMHPARKGEYTVDLENGTVLKLALQPAIAGDTNTLQDTLAQPGNYIREVAAVDASAAE